MRARVLLAAVALPLVLWAVIPLVSSGAPSSPSKLSDLERRIDRAREKIGRKKGAERTLSTEIAGYSRRIGRLQGRISTLGGRQERIEADLRRKQAELERLRGELRSERARLVRLRRRLAETRRLLRTRLVEIYKAEAPDLVTVVLNSDGFADLLERGEFIKRISAQDRTVVVIVREAKAEAVRTEERLDRLERRQQRVTAQVQERRDQVAGVKLELIGTRVGYARTKSGKAAALGKVTGDRRRLEQHVDGLEAASRRIQGQLQSAQRQNAGSLGPARQGSGSFVWPVNGAFTSPFGQRWGRLHAGIDIAAPEGTPIRAADSGRVVLMQGTGASGGYGNYTCVQHTASMSSCYAHQSRFGTSQGANVSKGQVIGAVGNTGNSFGAHLHFEVRINGSPVDPMGYL
ncbi:MAG: peptidoglycan DD-metalloendopeptidase family protein [Solirubrobacterales bacterium]|nr:peptidoglycan DD-metalloendopeptidase family protein [Solirubrobacterales bacterium]